MREIASIGEPCGMDDRLDTPEGVPRRANKL
jgi:hypothetical protein